MICSPLELFEMDYIPGQTALLFLSEDVAAMPSAYHDDCDVADRSIYRRPFHVFFFVEVACQRKGKGFADWQYAE